MSDLQSITRLMEELSLSLKKYAEAEAAMEQLAGDMHVSADLLQSILHSSQYEDADTPTEEENRTKSTSALDLHMKLQQLNQKKQESMTLLKSIVDIVRLARDGIAYTNSEWPATEAKIQTEYQEKIDAERRSYAMIQQQIRELKLSLDRRRRLTDKILNV